MKILTLLISTICFAETITIGVDSFCTDYKDNSPCSLAVLSATQSALLLNGEPVPRLVSELEVRPNHWAFLVAPDATFSNSTRIGLSDVFESLKQCGVPVTARFYEADSGIVEVTGDSKKISDCHIVPKGLLKENFFTGTHPIGAGAFYITKIRPGKSVDLRGKIKGKYHYVSIVVDPDPESAISKIRSGEFSSYFTRGEIGFKDDPTLQFFGCDGYKGVRRKSFIGYCFEMMSLENFRYAEEGS